MNIFNAHTKSTYQIRIASADDITEIYKMATSEGWNPGLSDAETVAKGMPDTFLAGVLNGTIIASIAATPYSSELGYISFYLVKPQYRKQGYGLPLWQAALKRLGTRNICLDAMPTQTEIYQQKGFSAYQAFCSYRFPSKPIYKPPNSSCLLPIQGELLEKVLIYDQPFFPAIRNQYMRQWLNQTNANSFAWQEKEKILGYGLIRKAQQGFRIGPCYADNSEVAYNLLTALMAQTNGHQVSISMPEGTYLTQDIVKQFRLEPGSRLQRMYTQNPIELPTERIVGITNFTFG